MSYETLADIYMQMIPLCCVYFCKALISSNRAVISCRIHGCAGIRIVLVTAPSQASTPLNHNGTKAKDG